MLYELRKHNNAVYPGTLNSQGWFKNSGFNIFNGIKSGRPVEFDKDLLLAEIKTDPIHKPSRN